MCFRTLCHCFSQFTAVCSVNVLNRLIILKSDFLWQIKVVVGDFGNIFIAIFNHIAIIVVFKINFIGLVVVVAIVKTFGVSGGVCYIEQLVALVFIIQIINLKELLLAFLQTVSFNG